MFYTSTIPLLINGEIYHVLTFKPVNTGNQLIPHATSQTLQGAWSLSLGGGSIQQITNLAPVPGYDTSLYSLQISGAAYTGKIIYNKKNTYEVSVTCSYYLFSGTHSSPGPPTLYIYYNGKNVKQSTQVPYNSPVTVSWTNTMNPNDEVYFAIFDYGSSIDYRGTFETHIA